ncbi:MAG: hypothetical protein H7099_13000 [Gemmatimonadaceae bacterium]|nr:hypothetical protein [Gemmatimonadaceae bacterium]
MLTVLAGCGGSSDSPAAPVPVIPAVPAVPVAPVVPGTPSVGTPAGTPVTRQIGPAGGTIVTADSGFSVIIPAGAIATTTAITIRPLVNTAPNSFGLEYAIEPANLQVAKPLQVKLAVPVAALGAVDPSWVGLGLRRNGVWYADFESTSAVTGATPRIASKSSALSAMAVAADADAGFAAVTGNVQNDDDDLPYLPHVAIVTYWKISATAATVRIRDTVGLSVEACTVESVERGPEITLLDRGCVPSIREATWRVNGHPGGTTQLGLAVRGNPLSSGRFTAPSRVPSPQKVDVTVIMFWRERGLTSRPLGPVPITITGGDLTGAASGTVSSRLAFVGALYDYKAVVEWERIPSNDPDREIFRVNAARSYVKYTPRNRCMTNMQPDSIPIVADYGKLTINNATQTWTDDEAMSYPLIRYFDTCARQSSYLEFSGAPYIASGGPLPVKGIFPDDTLYGVKIDMAYSYLREGEAERVAPRVTGGSPSSDARILTPVVPNTPPSLATPRRRITPSPRMRRRAPATSGVGSPFL